MERIKKIEEVQGIDGRGKADSKAGQDSGMRAGPRQIERPAKKRLRVALTVLAGLLIALLLGMLVSGRLLYRPAVQERNQANQRVTELEDQVAGLLPVINENQALQNELGAATARLDAATAHVTLLTILSDVNAARLALISDDAVSARSILLSNADQLQGLGQQLGNDHERAVTNIQRRMELAVSGLTDDPEVAQNDLATLANQLRQLEQTILSMP